MVIRSCLWRRLDQSGLEVMRLERDGSGWRMRGTALVLETGRPCRFDYDVTIDGAWRTRRARVSAWTGPETLEFDLESDGKGQWWSQGTAQPRLEGCLDVDLGFSPATNTIPIRRLELAVGASAPVPAAWIRFPELTLERLDQVYRRVAEVVYRYESGGGEFVTRLEVDSEGLVTRYGETWRLEA